MFFRDQWYVVLGGIQWQLCVTPIVYVSWMKLVTYQLIDKWIPCAAVDLRVLVIESKHFVLHSHNPFINWWFQICITISLTPCMIYIAKTSNIHSKFTHSNWITLSCYSSPKHKSLLPKYLFHFSNYNLEHGLAILTESFGPLKSELHNSPWWIQNEKCVPSYAIPFYIMCT